MSYERPRETWKGILAAKSWTVIVSALSVVLCVGAVATEGTAQMIVFSEGFESGQGIWGADNGVWEIGASASCHTGMQCAATVLDGNYPNNANTRLISPPVVLPTVQAAERVQLKFWQLFSIENGYDQGVVQISVDGGAWVTVSSPEFDGASVVWTQHIVDLTAYAGEAIRVGFYFSSEVSGTSDGWWLDDISIEKGPVAFRNPEDFELGVGNWSADNGLWEVGASDLCFSGAQCAATVLNGSYANNANTRFISPEVKLDVPTGQTPLLIFKHRFDIENSYDRAIVQVSVDGGGWTDISGVFTGSSSVWTQPPPIDLTPYAGQTIRVGFYFTSEVSGTSDGWWLDDIRILGLAGVDPTPIPTPTRTATVSPTHTATETPSQTVTPTVTGTAVRTPTPTATRTATSTPTVTSIRTVTPSPAPTQTPTTAPLGKAVDKCQHAIKKAGLTFVGKKLHSLDKCADAVLKCLQTKPVGPKRDKCRTAATTKCAGEIVKIGAEEGMLGERIRTQCAPELVSTDELRGAAGLGYDQIAAACQSEFGIALDDLEDIVECVTRQHQCGAEKLFDVQAPRARELLGLGGVSLDAESCFAADHGTGGSVPGLDEGRAVERCAASIKTASRKFVTKRLRSLEKCVDRVFTCLQTKEDPAERAACLGRAEHTCDQEFEKMAQEAGKLGPAVDQKCAAPSFVTLGSADGLNLAALAAECAAVDVTSVDSLGAYETCLVQQHTCAVDDLLRFEAPRAADLLALVHQSLGNPFCPAP